MSQQQSRWNQFFHGGSAYDTTFEGAARSPSPPPRTQTPGLSYFSYVPEAYSYLDNEGQSGIPMTSQRSAASPDLEKDRQHPVSPSRYEDPSFWATPANSTTDYARDSGTAGPRSPPTPTETPHHYGYRSQLEPDEELARRLQQEELDNSYRPPPENATYHGGSTDVTPPGAADAGHKRGSTRLDPNMPKGWQNPNVIKHFQKKTLWRPWFTWAVTLAQVIVIVLEFIRNQNVTGSLIKTKPQFNIMIGPAPEVLILMGARFTPCMKIVPELENITYWPCANETQIPNASPHCSLEEMCGFGGWAEGETPDQWYRFIIPIFLHGGLIHLAFNMIFQIQTGAQVERDMGFIRYGIIYMASGIFGFVFGGNFSKPQPSMGASGSLFGIIAVLLLELLQNWRLIHRPCWELTKMLLLIIVSFLIGLLPFLDNFAHIGGFVMGFLTGLVLMPTINFNKFHKRANIVLRLIALPIVIILFVVLIRNFYTSNPSEKCPWCKYLSCLPVNGWCDDTGFTTTTTNNTNGT